MLSIITIFITIYFWLITTVSVILTFFVCLIAYPFIDQKTFARVYEYVFCNFILYSMTLPGIWSIKTKDLRKSKNKHFNGRYVMISNHVSFIDTLMIGTIPFKKKYIMAKIFTQIPIFGWLCKSSGHVMVDNKDSSTTGPAVGLAIKAMEDGCSFFVYPEGKRSFDQSNLSKFKTGAFRIAQSTGVPILPIIIKGTGVGMKMWGICKRANLEIIIGESFNVEKGINDKESWENVILSRNKSKKFMEKIIKNKENIIYQKIT